jgi:SPP1 family phage portal protein
MEEILLLLNTDVAKALTILKSQGKDTAEIENIIKEYKQNDRKVRETQIGNIQKDKPINSGTEKSKVVKGVRIVVPFQKKIVTTSVAFEFGKPVTLIPSFEEGKESNIDKILKKMWKINRIDSIITKIKTLQKSETQAAISFYISEIQEGSIFQKVLAFFKMKPQKFEIKCNVLESSKGNMYPYFDAFGDMKFFTWEFTDKDEDGKERKNTWIYTNEMTYKIIGAGVPVIEKHGFDRIPIVYVSQEDPEWFDAEQMIDRYEVAISKLGASNDYSGHPMIKIFGEVQNAPDKDEDGKAWIIPITLDDDGKPIKGDVEFLEATTAPESNKLELETIENAIYAITSTPNLSFNNVKGIGSISGVALKLLFLDSIIKASANEGQNRTMVERIINIFVSGIVTTTNTGLKSESQQLFYDIQFNSILPDDLKESVEIVSAAVTAGVMSKQTGVEFLAMGEDTKAELDRIEADKKAAALLEKPVV